MNLIKCDECDRPCCMVDCSSWHALCLPSLMYDATVNGKKNPIVNEGDVRNVAFFNRLCKIDMCYWSTCIIVAADICICVTSVSIGANFYKPARLVSPPPTLFKLLSFQVHSPSLFVMDVKNVKNVTKFKKNDRKGWIKNVSVNCVQPHA